LAVQTALAQSSLLNYEHRIVRAAEQVARIKADREYAVEGVTYIKTLIPTSEQIQTPNGQVAVDNSWLWNLLDSYQKETDPQQMLATLNEAEGRLKALDEHLKRGQVKPDSERNASAEKQKVQEILSRPEYQEKRDTFIGRTIKTAIKKVREVIY